MNKKYMRLERNKNDRFTMAILVFLCVFLITKEIRAFSGSDVSGGVWNIIQLLFAGLGFIKLLQNCLILPQRPVFFTILLYTASAFLFAIPLMDTLAINTLFALLMILLPGLSFVLFYCVGLKIDVGKKNLLFPTFFIIAVILISALLRYYNQTTVDDERGAIADVYYILGLLPIVLAATKKKWVFVPIFVTALAVIVSTKRAGLLALAAMLIVYFLFALARERSLKKFAKILLVFILVAVLLVSFYLFMDQKFPDMRLLDRLFGLSEDGGSGRDVIWKQTWDAIASSDVLHLIFGHGKKALADVRGNAHNDFLQVFYEHGLIAFLSYIAFYLALIVELVRMVRAKYPRADLFAMSILCALFLAMFSFYVIAPTYVVCGMLCFGFFLADFHKFQAHERGINDADCD